MAEYVFMAKKIPFTVERTFKSSPAISWNGEEQIAEVLVYEEEEFIKLRWDDEEDDKAFFEYRIRVTDITKETILTVTDFAYKDEIESSKELWKSQLNDLAKALGNG